MSPTKKRVEAEKYGLAGFTYFPFDVIDWLTSPDVTNMSAAERGIYITLLAVQWRDGHVPADAKLLAKTLGLDYRSVANWLRNRDGLAPVLRHNCDTSAAEPSHIRCVRANEKLLKIALAKGKLRLGEGTEERRLEEIRREESMDVEGVDLAITLPLQTNPKPVSDQEPKEPSSSAPKPPLTEVAKTVRTFMKLLGSPDRYNNRKTGTKWEALVATLTGTQDHIRNLMHWAIEDSEVWARSITSVSRVDPMEYFVEKFYTIEAGCEGDAHAMAAREKRQKKLAAKPEPELDPLFRETKIADGATQRQLTRAPRTKSERIEVLALLNNPRTRREFVLKFLVQSNCPTCKGTDLGCTCATNEECL